MLVVPSASDDSAVRPTVVPSAASSATVLVPVSLSVGAETSNSSTSVSVMATVPTSEAPLLSLASRVSVHEFVSS